MFVVRILEINFYRSDLDQYVFELKEIKSLKVLIILNYSRSIQKHF